MAIEAGMMLDHDIREFDTIDEGMKWIISFVPSWDSYLANLDQVWETHMAFAKLCRDGHGEIAIEYFDWEDAGFGFNVNAKMQPLTTLKTIVWSVRERWDEDYTRSTLKLCIRLNHYITEEQYIQKYKLGKDEEDD
jgi:hypothetical protein